MRRHPDPNPPSGYGISLTGSATLTISGCGISDDATGSKALYATGGGGTRISATAINVVGGSYLATGITASPTPATGVTAASDPLSYFATPPPASDYNSGCMSDPVIKTSQTIGPGVSTGYVCYKGLSFPKGSPTVTLNPGLYIINGPNPLSVASGTTLNGTGVTFYFVNGGSFSVSNGATLNLSAPTTGTYRGLLFYQDPTDSAADSFVGGANGVLNGIFYLPTANLTFANGGSSTFSTDLVVGSLTMSGNAGIKPYTPPNGTSPLSTTSLTE